MRFDKPEKKYESEVQGPAIEYGKLRRWFATKIMRGIPNGFPDVFFARKVKPCPHCGNATQVVLIEFKREGESPKAHQGTRHRELREAGVTVHVVDTMEEAQRILK